MLKPSLLPLSLNNQKPHSIHSLSACVGACGAIETNPMAQAARPSAPTPNPCAAFRPAPPPLPARRPDAAPWPARPKDAPCPASSGDRGHPGQCKKAPDNVMHKPSGGTYSKPDARVKLIPAEDIITYARHGKPFGRTFGSADLRHGRRSVTPPPSSRKVSLARSTPVTQKATTPLSHKATTPVTHKAATQLTRKATSPHAHKGTEPLTYKPKSPLAHKPTTPPPPGASCLSAKRFETAGNRHIVSLKRPSPLCKAVQRGVVPPAVLRTESVKLSLLSPTSVLSTSSIEVCPDTRSRPSSRLNLFDGECKLASLQPETNMPEEKSPQSTTKSHIRNERQRDQEETNMPEEKSPQSTTKSHIRNERQRDQEASTSCNMSSGTPAVLPTKLYKKPDQSKSTTQAPHIRNVRQTNQEASTSGNMSAGAQAILHTELYKKPYQPESKTPGPCVELSKDLVDAVPFTTSSIRNERQTNQEAPISCNMPSGAPLILHTGPCKKAYQPQACWKGKFEVTGELTHTCDELEAHFPLEIFIKVYEASKQMPEILKLEALPLSHLLPKKFKMEPPDAQDIGLFFISSRQRPNTNFDHLLENVSSHIGLRTDIGATELLIFSSKLLTEDDQMKDGKLYFCGVFRKHNRKKQHRGNNRTDNVDISNAGSCSPISAGSLCKSAARSPACGDLILDSPPGFPLDVPPPGFTSAHRGLRTGETAESHVDDSPGDVPPGFTSAHRGLHNNEEGVSTLFSEKKSTIKFSLKNTRPVQTDAPPGFAKLLGVKKEPGLPEITPIREVNEKHDKVDVEVDDGSEERQFPKIKRLSDILGFSSSNNASNSSRSRNCSEVYRSAAAVPRESKFQEMGPPEKLCRKRGQPEPSESSVAEATKRLKVNGRIALNGLVDRRALNSNQAQGNGGKS